MPQKRKRNKFAGADDIYLTRKNIAVRKVSTRNLGNGNYRVTDKTIYYPKTRKNLNQANSIFGKLRFGR